jgi:hypothetical protein
VHVDEVLGATLFIDIQVIETFTFVTRGPVLLYNFYVKNFPEPFVTALLGMANIIMSV